MGNSYFFFTCPTFINYEGLVIWKFGMREGREGCALGEEKTIWKGKLLLTFSYVFVCLCFEGSVLANARQASSHPWSYISFIYEICKHAHHFPPSREVRATFSFASMYWFIYVPQALRHILVYPEVPFSDFTFRRKIAIALYDACATYLVELQSSLSRDPSVQNTLDKFQGLQKCLKRLLHWMTLSRPEIVPI